MAQAVLFPAVQRQFPGLLAAATIGVAATFLSDHYGGPAMLFALLLGMAFNFLSQDGPCVDGIGTASKSVLRLGVALLGMRITADQVISAGLEVPAMMVAAVAFTIGLGLFLGRLMRQERDFSLLTGCAVAICGASAALAVAAMLPRHRHAERNTIFTVIGVTTLSTLAMILYPILCKLFGLDHLQAGIFLGGTIHDVAQVVGAGYSISPETGDTATFVKLFRVAMLLPVAVLVGMSMGRGAPKSERPPLLPPFLIGFIVLVAVNSTGLVPPLVVEGVNQLSRWCLVTAIAALGVKTSLKSMVELGLRPVLLLVAETVGMAALVMAMVLWRG
ncbi:MAG: YeiH family protein [Magnetospirillum sp.]